MISGVDSWLRTNPVVAELLGPSHGSFIPVPENRKTRNCMVRVLETLDLSV